MKIPTFIVSTLLGCAVLLEAWTLNEIVNLKVEVSAIKTQLTATHIAQK